MLFYPSPSRAVPLLLLTTTASFALSHDSRHHHPATRSCAFLPAGRISSKQCLSRRRRQQHSLQLNLFALNLFGENDENKDDEEKTSNDGADATVPPWVNTIKQWPLYPTGQILTPPTLDEEKEALSAISADADDKKGFFSFVGKMPEPLTSLVNVEALLMASRSRFSESDEVEVEVEDAETLQQKRLHDPLIEKLTATISDWTNKNNTTENTTTSSSSVGDNESHANGHVEFPEPWSILPDIEELSGWNRWIQSLQRSLTSLPLDAVSKVTLSPSGGGNASLGISADSILREASSRIDFLVTEISTALSPTTIQDLIVRAGQTLEQSKTSSEEKNNTLSTRVTTSNTTMASELMEAAVMLSGKLDVRKASKAAHETKKFASSLVSLANQVLLSGFAIDDTSAFTGQAGQLKSTPKTLFADFGSARVLSSQHGAQVVKAAEMGALAGAIYQETVPRTHALGHTIVANGTTADVVWMVTDTIATESDFREPTAGNFNFNKEQQSKPVFVRTITVRGFDASDITVDRERLLNAICTASPERLGDHVLVHSGIMSLARQIYQDIKKYITWTAPDHRLVFNGHSVGGSISILMLLLLAEEFGGEFVEDKVLRVFTFGSPPVTTTTYKHVKAPKLKNPDYMEVVERGGTYQCDVLKEFNLHPFTVYGFAQPWDPIVRLFSPIDALYPLLGDLGADGVTLYASGPPRSLRPVLRAVVESWEGWPIFRDNFRSSASQNYTSVGVQHIFLPEGLRYLSDRVVGANVGVPPVEAVLRICSTELLSGLQQNFPLDVFQISFIPAAIRGFIHHFYPAYGVPFVDFAAKFAKPKENTPDADDLMDAVGVGDGDEDDIALENVAKDDLILIPNGVDKMAREELGIGLKDKLTNGRLG